MTPPANVRAADLQNQLPRTQHDDAATTIGIAVLNHPNIHRELTINYLTYVRDKPEELTEILQEAGLPFECMEVDAPPSAEHVSLEESNAHTHSPLWPKTQRVDVTPFPSKRKHEEHARSAPTEPKRHNVSAPTELESSNGPLTWIKENPGKTAMIILGIGALAGVGYYMYRKTTRI